MFVIRFNIRGEVKVLTAPEIRQVCPVQWWGAPGPGGSVMPCVPNVPWFYRGEDNVFVVGKGSYK